MSSLVMIGAPSVVLQQNLVFSVTLMLCEMVM